MNVCFCSREYPPETHVGGIGTYTHNMARALSDIGHTVHVISSTSNSDHTIQNQNLFIHRIKKWRILPKELGRLGYSWSLARKLHNIDCHFDIVQACEFANEGFWFALKNKSTMVTRLATPFSIAEDLDGAGLFGPRVLLDWMERKQTLNSDGVFASSHALAKAVAKKWRIERSRIDIIPNSIDIPRIVQLAKNAPPPDILRGRHFLLYFGRLEERKGVRVLARALPSIFGHFPNLRMLFVGSDLGHRGTSMKEHIMKIVGRKMDQVIFFDNLAQEQLFPIVNLAKIVVLPSLWEAFGFVCLEAMALGRPVIAASGSGFAEIIEDNASGLLVEKGNSTLLAQKIIGALNDTDTLRRISEGARRRSKDFEVSKVALKLLVYYKRVREEWLKKRR